MYTEKLSNTKHESVLEQLSKEFNVPIAEVTRIYTKELEKVGVDARITQFLSIFAFRNVREFLSTLYK